MIDSAMNQKKNLCLYYTMVIQSLNTIELVRNSHWLFSMELLLTITRCTRIRDPTLPTMLSPQSKL